MNKITRALTAGSLFMLVTTSCEFNNEEELYGNEIIIPTEVSYSTDISPIIEMNCVTCHTQGGFGNGFFDTYAGVKEKVDNGSFRQRVLVQMDMPPGGRLSDQELELIESWLDNGAPDN